MIAHYHVSCPTTCACADSMEVFMPTFGMEPAIAAVKAPDRFCRELARKYKAKRQRNKSTCPTALLTPKCKREKR